MTIAPRRLSRLLVTLVLAFAPTERRPLVAAVELFRGLAIQLAVRWGSGHVLAEDGDRAVLLWSTCAGPRRRGRELVGVAAGVCTGLGLFVGSNLLLLGPLHLVLDWTGASQATFRGVALAVLAVRLSLTLWRAVTAYRFTRQVERGLPPARGTRWRIDYLGAVPSGRGHGGELLTRFCRLADAAGAEVVLHCDPDVVGFYGRCGFRAVDRTRSGQVLMSRPVGARRVARTPRRAAQLRRRPARTDSGALRALG